jgi:hypothetical protein
MGLDMYFEKRKIKWHGLDEAPQSTIEVFNGGYFRKFNALHGWIVGSCGGGVDECQPIPMDSRQLKTLLEVLETVKENPTMADELLPLTDGFFFGVRRTVDGEVIREYGDYYFQDVADAIEVVKSLLEWLNQNEDLGGKEWHEVIYQASW